MDCKNIRYSDYCTCFAEYDENNRIYRMFEESDLTLIEEPKNYIAEFMKDNGLEIGEKFKIEGEDGDYIFQKDCLMYKKYNGSLNGTDALLNRMLIGALKVIKIIKMVRIDWDTVKGENIEVSDDTKNWYEKKFVLKYQDKFFCENPYDGQLYGWKYARLIKEGKSNV